MWRVRRLPEARVWIWCLGDEISVDLITDLPLTKRGNLHILHNMEGFSGFEEAYPLMDKRCGEVAACIVDYCFRYGFPGRSRSDLKGEFQGKELAEVCNWAGIEMKHSASHHQAGKGQIERTNQSLKNELGK